MTQHSHARDRQDARPARFLAPGQLSQLPPLLHPRPRINNNLICHLTVAAKIMGKAYSEEQRLHVKGLLEQGRDEESIEKDTGVSDRTIRRWKLELERTGRIGKVWQYI